MIKAITRRDDDGAVDFVCDTTDAIATWPAGCAAASAPDGYGAGSTMTIIDQTTTPKSVSGLGWYSGEDWAMV